LLTINQTWLDHTTPPPLEFAKCKVCNDLMSLLLQLNGDLPEHFPGHERRLYIFTCRRRTCQRKQGSVRGFRGVRVNALEEKAKPKEKGRDFTDREEPATEPTRRNIGNDLFGTNPTPSTSAATNPFSTPSTQNPNPFSTAATTNPAAHANANPFATISPTPPPPQNPPKQQQQQLSPTTDPTTDLPTTFASHVRLTTPPPPAPAPQQPTPWPPQTAFPPPYPHSHLDADYETITKISTTHPNQNQNQNQNHFDPDLDPTHPATTTAPDTSDPYESPLDKPFLHFADRLAQNPLQVLRYHFRGAPLLCSDSDPVGKLFSATGTATRVTGAVSMPRCSNCGAQRVFEVQVMPRAIAELEGEDGGLGWEGEGMEWGTVVLGVCGGDCAVGTGGMGEGVGYVEEWVGVQWEERVGGGGRG